MVHVTDAAIGLSEQTDAVVVVVSEETGTISYTYGGHIYRHLPEDQIKEALRTFMERPSSNHYWYVEMGQKMMIHLKRNWPAKLLSLLAAIVMWFFIMRDQNPVMEVTYTVPVQVQNLDSHYIIEDAPDVARIVLSGPSRYDYVYKGR